MTDATAPDESWPIPRSQRTFGAGSLLVVLIVAAAANWSYIIGELVGSYLGLEAGFAALTAGSLLGMGLVVLATLPTSIRFGVDSLVAIRPQLGTAGYIVTVPLQYVSIVGWNAILLIFCGRSIAEFLRTTGVTAENEAGIVVPLTTIVSLAVVFLVLRGGLARVQKVANVLFVLIVAVALWMVWLLVTEHAGTVAEAKPRFASPDPRWNFVTGIEIGIAAILSWWPYVGAMVRHAPAARAATVPLLVGLGLPGPMLSAIGLAAVLATGVSDPARWMTALGGPVYGAIALAFLAVTNLGTALIGLYSSAVGLRSVPWLGGAKWDHLLLAGILPAAVVGIFLHEPFYASFGSFIAFLGVLFAPLCGIQIADYYLLRRRRIDVRALYLIGSGAPYHYWGGINPAAIAGMSAGFAAYIYLLHPLSYASHWPYEYLTASLPTAAVGAGVHVAVTLALVRPAGKGGYRATR
jgi:NCS1 family nucleobase:cation symporter-1